MEALSEEEVDRVTDTRSVRPTPEGSLHSMEDTDDDNDPNYARIGDFRPAPRSSSPPPSSLAPGPHQSVAPPPGPYRLPDDLDGLYAKVNKLRQQALDNEPPRHQGQQQRREYQHGRPAPAYEELDKMAPRGADLRPAPPYDDLDGRQPTTHTRRKDPYDYPTHSGPYPSHSPPQAQRGRQPDAHNCYTFLHHFLYIQLFLMELFLLEI